MKIIYLSDSTVPSNSTNSVHVMKMCSAFAAAKHGVSLFAYADSTSAPEAHAYYSTSHDFEIVDIGRSRVPGIRRLYRAWFAFDQVRRSTDVSLAYGRDLYGTLAASFVRIPVVFEAHTPPRTRGDFYLTSWLFHRRSFRRLVVISEALRQEYLRIFPDLNPENLVVAHDGADIEEAKSESGVRLSLGRKDALQLGYVGSLLPGKGSELVISLAHRLPEYDFHIVGGNTEEVEQLRISNALPNLFFHGHIPHAAVPANLERLDIALFPMQEAVVLPDGTDIGQWTSPMKLFEYMAARRAIIGSDLPVVRELLHDGANAVLVSPTDLDAWSSAIGKLANNRSLRQQLGNHAYEQLKSKYTWKQRANIVLADMSRE